MRLTNAGDEIAGALRHHRRGLEVVGLYQETLPWVDAAPHVAECLATDLAHARNERLRVDGLGDGVAPGQRIERAEVVGRKRHRPARTCIAEAVGQGSQGSAAGMPDAVDILEAGQVVALRRGRDQVAPALRQGRWRRQGRHLAPGIAAGVGIARHHQLGNEVANLGRGSHRAAEGRAQ